MKPSPRHPIQAALLGGVLTAFAGGVGWIVLYKPKPLEVAQTEPQVEVRASVPHPTPGPVSSPVAKRAQAPELKPQEKPTETVQLNALESALKKAAEDFSKLTEARQIEDAESRAMQSFKGLGQEEYREACIKMRALRDAARVRLDAPAGSVKITGTKLVPGESGKMKYIASDQLPPP